MNRWSWALIMVVFLLCSTIAEAEEFEISFSNKDAPWSSERHIFLSPAHPEVVLKIKSFDSKDDKDVKLCAFPDDSTGCAEISKTLEYYIFDNANKMEKVTDKFKKSTFLKIRLGDLCQNGIGGQCPSGAFSAKLKIVSAADPNKLLKEMDININVRQDVDDESSHDRTIVKLDSNAPSKKIKITNTESVSGIVMLTYDLYEKLPFSLVHKDVGSEPKEIQDERGAKLISNTYQVRSNDELVISLGNGAVAGDYLLEYTLSALNNNKLILEKKSLEIHVADPQRNVGRLKPYLICCALCVIIALLVIILVRQTKVTKMAKDNRFNKALLGLFKHLGYKGEVTIPKTQEMDVKKYKKSDFSDFIDLKNVDMIEKKDKEARKGVKFIVFGPWNEDLYKALIDEAGNDEGLKEIIKKAYDNSLSFKPDDIIDGKTNDEANERVKKEYEQKLNEIEKDYEQKLAKIKTRLTEEQKEKETIFLQNEELKKELNSWPDKVKKVREEAAEEVTEKIKKEMEIAQDNEKKEKEKTIRETIIESIKSQITARINDEKDFYFKQITEIHKYNSTLKKYFNELHEYKDKVAPIMLDNQEPLAEELTRIIDKHAEQAKETFSAIKNIAQPGNKETIAQFLSQEDRTARIEKSAHSLQMMSEQEIKEIVDAFMDHYQQTKVDTTAAKSHYDNLRSSYWRNFMDPFMTFMDRLRLCEKRLPKNETATDADEAVKKLYSKIKTIYDELKKQLEVFDIVPIQIKVRETICDPKIMETDSREEDASQPAEMVLRIIRQGYTSKNYPGDKPMVVINKVGMS